MNRFGFSGVAGVRPAGRPSPGPSPETDRCMHNLLLTLPAQPGHSCGPLARGGRLMHHGAVSAAARAEGPLSGRPMTQATVARVDPQDAELVARVARDDEAALGQLYDRFGQVLYAVAYRILGESGLPVVVHPQRRQANPLGDLQLGNQRSRPGRTDHRAHRSGTDRRRDHRRAGRWFCAAHDAGVDGGDVRAGKVVRSEK